MGYKCDVVDNSTARQIVQTGQCPGVQDDPISTERLTDPMVFLCGEGTHREDIKCYNKSTIRTMYNNRGSISFTEPTSRGQFTNAAMDTMRREFGVQHTPQQSPLYVMSRPQHRRVDSNDFFNAVIAGVQSTVKRYLDSGGSVNVRDYRGNTALMKAAFNGDTQMVMILALHGADINAQNDVGMTPLMAAAASGNYNVVDFLLRSGANPRITSYDGKSVKDFSTTNRITKLFGGPLNTRINVEVRYKSPSRRKSPKKSRRKKSKKSSGRRKSPSRKKSKKRSKSRRRKSPKKGRRKN